MQFDMLTTIVIGNRFTARKGNYIYTPRGYNDWAGSAVQAEADALPSGAAWVFSGTSDGNALAREMLANDHKVVVSTATEYGGELAMQDCPGVAVWAGRQGMEARRQALVKQQARIIVDATHPFATLISEQLLTLSSELGIPYIRYERPTATIPEEVLTSVKFCNSMQEAAQLAISIGKRIFLATGSKDLATFLQTQDAAERQWFTRITPEPELIQRAIELGIPRAHICAMQGPFSEAINVALWQDWQIDCIITKDSGDAGGMMAKVQAAKKLGVPIIVIARPNMQYPLVASTFESVLEKLACKP
jgi:precorrin-3B C17-methyltransferase